VIKTALGQGNPADDDYLQFAKQLGCDGIVAHVPDLPHPDGFWRYDDLVVLRERVNRFGLELLAIENTPWEMYEDCMIGGPQRDRQIESYCTTITNLGRAGIDKLGLCWMPNSVWSSSFSTPGRGGVEVRSFDYNDFLSAPLSHGRAFDEDEVWELFEYFITRVISAAESAGVRLAIHPDDPPVPSLGGIARIFRDVDGFRRATEEICPSPNLGLNFCMGTWSEIGPGIALEAMEYFAERDRVVYVHFRDVKGHLPEFAECFIGEGNINPVDAIMILKRAGYDGFVEDDHVPVMLGDENKWAPRGRAYTAGYLQGLLRAVEQLG
jgi:mannonate dehydratase